LHLNYNIVPILEEYCHIGQFLSNMSTLYQYLANIAC